MTENSVRYVDQVDGSALTVEPVKHADFEGHLRFTAQDSGTDLTRADVQSLIQYALEWLEGTRPKPPTTPGSVVRVPRDDRTEDSILTRLTDDAAAGLELRHARWVSQHGAFWTDHELMDFEGGRFEVIYDAGKDE